MEKVGIFLVGLIFGLILMAVCIAANNADKKLEEFEKKDKNAHAELLCIGDDLALINLKEQIRKVECGESSIINCPQGYYVQKVDDKWVIYRN